MTPGWRPRSGTAAQNATHTSAGSFFFSESLETADDPATTTIEGSSSVLPTGTVDDTTIPVQVKSSDFAKDPSRPGVWVAWIAVLGQVLETPVSIDDAGQFRKTVITSQRAASTNPLVPDPPAHHVEDPMTELFGKYRATVVDNADPTAQGRLQGRRTDRVGECGLGGGLDPAGAPVAAADAGRGLHDLGGVRGGRRRRGRSGPARPGAPRPPGPVTLESDGALTLRAATLTVEAAMADYSGVLKSQTLITNSVVAASYTPGAGNIA